MKRREFMGKVGTVGLGIAVAGAVAPSKATAQTVSWNVATSWPPKMPCLQEGTERIAERVDKMTNGRFKIRVFAGGELVGPMDVFDAVNQGRVAQASTTALYYFVGKAPEAQIFSACPFGMTHRELAAWVYQGGGLELYHEILKPYNMIAFPMASTGTQMGGWFRKEIKSAADLKGLKMRIPGLGGKVMTKLGVNVVNLPGSEVFPAMERGILDACEWALPLYDINLSLHQVAKFYYAPGWQEPTTFVDMIINLKTWEALPPDLKLLIETCCSESMNWTLARSDVKNGPVLKELTDKHGVKLMMYPNDVMKVLGKATAEVMDEETKKFPLLKKVYDHQLKFISVIRPWMKASEWAFVNTVES